MMQDQCVGLEAFFDGVGFLSIFFDITCDFVILFNDPYALMFVILAAFVGIVFGALPGLTAAAAIAMMLPILIAYNDEIGGLAGLAFLYVIKNRGDTAAPSPRSCSTRRALRRRPRRCRTAIR